MELRQLRFFLRAAELGSISRAALEARIAQPALSRQMRTLEEALGVQLFVRNGRGVTLTEVGKQFYDRVSGILQNLDNTCIGIRDQQKLPSGEVRLGVLPNFGGQFEADLILLCEKAFPNIKLLLFEGFSYQIAAWMQSKQIDLGFLYEVDSYRQLHAEFQFRENAFLAGSPDGWEFGDTVTLETLQNLRLITPAPPSLTRRSLISAAAQRGFELNFAYEIDSLVAIKHLLASKRGYGVFTRSTINEEIQSGRLAAAKIVDPEITFDLALASTYGAILPLAARRMIDFLKTVVADSLAEGRWSGRFITEADRHTAKG